MHNVEFKIPLSGSKLFDVMMYNTAKKMCAEYPGLNFEYGKTGIRLYGELTDSIYEKYQIAMFGNKA